MATLESKVTLGKEVLFRDLGGEAVFLNLQTGKYYGLDEVSTRIWALLTQYGEVKQVCAALLAEYDVNEERLQEDLLHFIDELVSHGLLQIDKG
ncbi:MAG: PqqD family peptide modification chaperone [Anaerolineae bacterium]